MSGPVSNWGEQMSVTDQNTAETADAPAMTEFEDTLYMVYRGSSVRPGLWLSPYAGDIWLTQTHLLTADNIRSGPGVCVWDDDLFIVYHKNSDNTIQYMTYNTNLDQGKDPQTVPNARTSDRPSVTVYQGKIYLAYTGEGAGGNLYYMTYDGNTWSEQSKFDNASQHSPALGVFNDKLHLTHKGKTNNNIYEWILDGTNWKASGQITGKTSEGPTLATVGNYLYNIYRTSGADDKIWYSYYDGSQWRERGCISDQNDALTSHSVGASAYRGELHLGYRGKGSADTLWACHTV